ncbi:MAG: exodeoxyribonuclease VII large subunit [Rickettsiales bacterium]|nr:exodeoxyribonuclease VII large subunit [Rickettsiales bacterium]
MIVINIMLNINDFNNDMPAGKNEFSVTEISNKIKWLLENNFSTVRIKGEVSGLKIASSGHGYFNLKDTNAVIAATCWRHCLSRVNFSLAEGLEVIVTGKITSYAGQSKYQIAVELIEPAGVGAFIKILSERRQKLEEEGLFKGEYKKKIPYLPKKIGVITSLTGAVIKDIIHRITDRLPVHLCIWPVTVQGATAANEITTAINGFNLLKEELKPDVIIIARGGGSIEDLWPFNEEIVVRAAFNSSIPIISAVGHETDYTLLDLVADLRAPTPTAAAEFAVPVISNLKYKVNSLYNNIERRVSTLLKHKSHILSNYNRLLQYPVNYLNYNIQKLDDLGFRLTGSLPNLLKQKNLALQYFPYSRFKPTKIIHYKYLQLNHLQNNLLVKKITLLNRFEHKLSINSSILASLDYNKVLARGYAMLKDHRNNYISTVSEAQSSKHITANLKDGQVKLSIFSGFNNS